MVLVGDCTNETNRKITKEQGQDQAQTLSCSFCEISDMRSVSDMIAVLLDITGGGGDVPDLHFLVAIEYTDKVKLRDKMGLIKKYMDLKDKVCEGETRRT